MFLDVGGFALGKSSGSLVVLPHILLLLILLLQNQRMVMFVVAFLRGLAAIINGRSLFARRLLWTRGHCDYTAMLKLLPCSMDPGDGHWQQE